MRWIVLAAVLVGCGGSGSDAGDVLANTTWVTGVSGTNCATGFGFYDAGTYAHLTLCTLTDGTQALEVDSGDYVVNGNSLGFVLRKATCFASDYVSLTPSFTFSVTSAALSLSSSSGLLVLPRSQTMPGDPNGGGAATYGCFRSDGYFYAQPLAAL